MTVLLPILLAGGVFLAAWWLTDRVRRYALARHVLDVPNARSSHRIPTPRGGGMAIVVTTLAGLLVLGWLGVLRWEHVWGMTCGGAIVAAIGFVDDHRPLARRWRLVGHFAAAACVLSGFGGLPPLPVFGVVVDCGWLGQVAAAVYLVWMLNLTNFMDGIDGIAAIEVITVSLGGMLLYLSTVPDAREWIVPAILAASTLGFLVWNWPPAKIFMGDAGSGFVGLTLAALSVQAAWTAPALFWAFVILVGVFVVDATVTLLRRMLRGERVYEAHRMHAYQHAAGVWGAHKPVTVAVAAINVGWLLPIAWLAAQGRVDGVAGVAIAYAPLVGMAFWMGAGAPEPNHDAGPART